MPNYPEHEKMLAHRNEAQAQGEFVEWLVHNSYLDYRCDKTLEQLIAEFHDIDLDVIRREKAEMLVDIRKANTETEAQEALAEARRLRPVEVLPPTSGKYVVAVGDPFDGVRLVGPFDSHDDAIEYGMECGETWTAVPVEAE